MEQGSYCGPEIWENRRERVYSFMENHFTPSKVSLLYREGVEQAWNRMKEKYGDSLEYISPLKKEAYIDGYTEGFVEAKVGTVFMEALYSPADGLSEKNNRRTMETIGERVMLCAKELVQKNEWAYVLKQLHNYIVSELSFMLPEGFIDKDRLHQEHKTIREALREADRDRLYQVYRKRHPIDYEYFEDDMKLCLARKVYLEGYWNEIAAILGDSRDVGCNLEKVVFTGVRVVDGVEKPYACLSGIDDLLENGVEAAVSEISAADREAVGGYLLAGTPLTQICLYEILADILYAIGLKESMYGLPGKIPREPEVPDGIADEGKQRVDTDEKKTNVYEESLWKDLKRNTEGNRFAENQYERYYLEKEISSFVLSLTDGRRSLGTRVKQEDQMKGTQDNRK